MTIDSQKIILRCQQSVVVFVIKFVMILPFFVLTGWTSVNKLAGVAIHWTLDVQFPGMIFISFIGIIHLFYMSPTFWVTDEGILIRFPLRKILVNWDDIIQVRRGTIQTFIVFRKLVIPNYLVGWIILQLHPAVTFSRSRENYNEILKLLKSKIPHKVI